MKEIKFADGTIIVDYGFNTIEISQGEFTDIDYKYIDTLYQFHDYFCYTGGLKLSNLKYKFSSWHEFKSSFQGDFINISLFCKLLFNKKYTSKALKLLFRPENKTYFIVKSKSGNLAFGWLYKDEEEDFWEKVYMLKY